MTPLPTSRTAASIGLVAVGVVAACDDAGDRRASVPAKYEFLLGGNATDDHRRRLAYEKVELEYFSTWTWGGDRIVLEVDGSASMVDHRGRWMGGVSLRGFGHLCYLLETLGFEQMERRYSREVFDAETVTVRAWPRGSSEPIVVESYAGAAPIEFRTIVLAINGVAREVTWEPDPRAGPGELPADER